MCVCINYILILLGPPTKSSGCLWEQDYEFSSSVILLQVGAIAPQSLENLLQSIHECLGSTDWATRKAAADSLTALALHSSVLISDKAASTLTVLESYRFDKVASAILFEIIVVCICTL